MDMIAYDDVQEKKDLINELSLLNLELKETFNKNGTQAMIVVGNTFAALAFRGTEATSIKDIKADAKAVQISCDTKGNIHSGFDEAYKQIHYEIEKVLEEKYADLPLFVTGHSLGGALATIAAKKLSHKGGIAACYTFGAPRVGDQKWIEDGFKTPVYRLVNAADCVTMFPPSDETITVLAWVAGFIPWVGGQARKMLLSRFKGYLHGGNMRYLNNCPPNHFENVRLLYSVSLFFRTKGLIVKKLPWKKTLSDHFIKVYRKKLFIIADRNNPG